MATGSQAGPVQCLSWEDKAAASQTDLLSWVSEWRDCSLGTITRGEAKLLGKFLTGFHWKLKEEEDEGRNYFLVILSRRGTNFYVCVRTKTRQQWLFFILLLAALHTLVPASPAGNSTWEVRRTRGREQGFRYICCAVDVSCIHCL